MMRWERNGCYGRFYCWSARKVTKRDPAQHTMIARHNEADPNFIVYFLAFENLGNAALPASVPAWVHSLTTNKAFLVGASIMELNFWHNLGCNSPKLFRYRTTSWAKLKICREVLFVRFQECFQVYFCARNTLGSKIAENVDTTAENYNQIRFRDEYSLIQSRLLGQSRNGFNPMIFVRSKAMIRNSVAFSDHQNTIWWSSKILGRISIANRINDSDRLVIPERKLSGEYLNNICRVIELEQSWPCMVSSWQNFPDSGVRESSEPWNLPLRTNPRVEALPRSQNSS